MSGNASWPAAMAPTRPAVVARPLSLMEPRTASMPRLSSVRSMQTILSGGWVCLGLDELERDRATQRRQSLELFLELFHPVLRIGDRRRDQEEVAPLVQPPAARGRDAQ